MPTDHVRMALLLIPMILLAACQRKPALGGAADPMSALEPPPMGSSTYNDELKNELALLDDLLEKRVNEQQLVRIKNALIHGMTNMLSKDNRSLDASLAKLLLTLPELIHHSEEMTQNHQRWLKAKYLFLKRRFIEAAMLMTEVLIEDPTMDEARNWRARAIFILGNLDLAIKELTMIVAKNGESSPTGLDALYLIGAMIFESNDIDKKRIAAGIHAWSRYLELAEVDDSFKKDLNESMAELRRRETDAPLPGSVDPFAPSDLYSRPKNAVLTAFLKEELLLAEQLAEDFLKQTYDPDIATIKARIFFKTGRIDEAKKLYTAIVDQDDNYAPAHHYRGMAFMMQGEPKNAILSWRKTLEKNPRYAQAYNLEQRIAAAEKMMEPTKIETH